MNRIIPVLIASLLLSFSLNAAPRNYVETDGMVAVEAEHFASQSKDSIRRWYITSSLSIAPDFPDPDGNHAKAASGGAYIEVLPDTRTNHDEKLIRYTDDETEANFSPVPGNMAVLSYPIYFNTPGVYIFWARAFSTGPEDNGLHVGLDGIWPEGSSRVQLCEGKYQWTWSSAQRRDHNHCGDPRTILVSVPNKGLHTIMLSMREDGFELDKFILTKDFNFQPEAESIPASIRQEQGISRGTSYQEISNYDYRLESTTNFFPVEGTIPYYTDKRNRVLAINAAKKENRNAFAAAHLKFNGEARKYRIQLVTLTEIDGESQYRVTVGDSVLGTFTNPEGREDYSEAIFDCGEVTLEKKMVIQVESNAVTNGKIPENDETAYSRGRWRGLILTRID